MHADLDIIYFTLFPWDNAYSSVSLSFTREFAKNNRVFYINHPYSVKDFLKGWKQPMVQQRKGDLLANKMRYETIPELPEVVAVQPPLTLPINWMQPGKTYDKLYEYNNRIIVNTIRQVVKDYKLKNYIYLNCFNPYYAGVLPKDMKPRLNIYQCIDDMTQEAYTAKHGARVEEEALRNADIAFVTSRMLHRLKKHLNPNTYVLHNAVDISIFREALEGPLPRPEELQGVKGKIIGFTGNINEYRLNYPLFKKIAEQHPDKTLVLVGPLNSECYKDYGLDKMPNVILTGGKHIRELPAFLQHFDVAIIPFLKNKLTASIYPLKINEYLAAGKPVVATDFSEDIRSFAKDIYLAESEDAFVNLINKAIGENCRELVAQRVATANQNTWTERVKQFWEVVDEHLAGVRQLV
ncbi:MAG: glycosyltransferase [Lewinellaceae bacterium]|nr:glycosyltransferase [Saprospiraceae bacterium]MCB9341158.1 glycosyltransferase [Lewinellaceae bacterium]